MDFHAVTELFTIGLSLFFLCHYSEVLSLEIDPLSLTCDESEDDDEDDAAACAAIFSPRRPPNDRAALPFERSAGTVLLRPQGGAPVLLWLRSGLGMITQLTQFAHAYRICAVCVSCFVLCDCRTTDASSWTSQQRRRSALSTSPQTRPTLWWAECERIHTTHAIYRSAFIDKMYWGNTVVLMTENGAGVLRAQPRGG